MDSGAMSLPNFTVNTYPKIQIFTVTTMDSGAMSLPLHIIVLGLSFSVSYLRCSSFDV
jgi:hypothetical protein